MYDEGIEPVKWVRDCTKIKANIVYLLSKGGGEAMRKPRKGTLLFGCVSVFMYFWF
jgi:hypothetical protein